MNNLGQKIAAAEAELTLLRAERERQVVAGYRAGADTTTLAEEFACSRAAVYQILHRGGVRLRFDHGPREKERTYIV